MQVNPLPTIESEEVIINKLYQLAKEKNIAALQKLSSREKQLLQQQVVQMLAREGNETIVNFLIANFNADNEYAIIGYAWGGHVTLLGKYRGTPPMWLIEGFALGRQIELINKRITITEEDSCMIGGAANSYSEGGHVENIPDTLELMTLTTNQSLKRCLARILKEKIDSVDVNLLLAKADKLSMLMQSLNITYLRALEIVMDVENNESPAITEKGSENESKTASTLSSLSLFKRVAEENLNSFQIKALTDLRDYGLTENIMLNWKPHKQEHCFSCSHLAGLAHLLIKQHLSPFIAIQEINKLTSVQIDALIELYSFGLRGKHLRDWQKQHAKRIFTEASLDTLLEMSKQNSSDLITALNKIEGERPTARIVEGAGPTRLQH